MFGDNMFDRFGKVFRSGEIIFCEFEPGDDFYLIMSGHVRITKVLADKEKSLDVFQAGDIFGEMAILEQQPRSATAIAQDEVKALVFNRQNFELLLKSNPEIAIKLLKTFARRIYDAKRQLQVLTFSEPDVRLADVFVLLAEKHGALGDEASKVELPVSREDLLSLSGLEEKEMVKILDSLAHQNRIAFHDNKLVINNIKEFDRLVSTRRKNRSA
jgi:CRP-like cAMP-binding protein